MQTAILSAAPRHLEALLRRVLGSDRAPSPLLVEPLIGLAMSQVQPSALISALRAMGGHFLWFLAVFGPLLLFRALYYGELLPNSVIAKSGYHDRLLATPGCFDSDRTFKEDQNGGHRDAFQLLLFPPFQVGPDDLELLRRGHKILITG